jgi:hypothetical protein
MVAPSLDNRVGGAADGLEAYRMPLSKLRSTRV